MRRALKTAALCLFVSSTALADVIYVNLTATGTGDGSTWANAFLDLQDAIVASGSGDEIWVAAGTYLPTDAADRTISFTLKNGVGIYGGFAGTEATRGQRNPATHVTILSGDIGTPAVPGDNSYHVVTVGGVTASAVLDGFTLTLGQANGSDPDIRGGGMLITGGSPTLANLKFVSNFASTAGGGLRVSSGVASMTNCSFVSNSVSGGTGGGLSQEVGALAACTNCVFRSNSVTGVSVGSGGISSGGGLTLVNTIVAQNSPSGLHLSNDNNTLENCTIAHNSVYGIGLFGSNNNTLTNTIIWGNGTDGIFNNGSSSFSASYCDTQTAVLPGTGNLSSPPLFVAPPGDLRLGPGSPAVDSGNNGAVPAGVTTDVAGLPRFFDDPAVPNTGVGTPPIVDMGAHERVPLSVSAPSDLSICAGGDAEFSVVAAGQATLTYQWRAEGTPLSDGGRIGGAHTDTLTVSATIPGDSGSYDVLVTDGVGQSLTSPAASLVVNPVPAAPTITAPNSVTVGSTGNTATVASHAGSTWTWLLTGGAITGGQGTNQLTFSAGPAGQTMLLSVSESNAGCTSLVASLTVQVDFVDVPPADSFHDYVAAVARNGITAGCGSGFYCRNTPVTRAQMAVFLLKSKYGSNYIPPGCASKFTDVACPSTFANWIEELSSEGITAGCGPGLYCPTNPVTRQQMAVFLLRTEHGSAYVPPVCSTVFNDVACPSQYADWIEKIYADGITGGCATGPLRYCPTNPNTRGQMAVFLVKTFDLE